jgi:hypothetical protein
MRNLPANLRKLLEPVFAIQVLAREASGSSHISGDAFEKVNTVAVMCPTIRYGEEAI